MFAGLGLGIGLIIAGLGFVLLVWGFLRLLSVAQSEPAGGGVSIALPEISQSTEAMLVIQPGGRVEYLSPLARQWFGLSEDEPADLERLARRVRPTDEFLNLCLAPGQKHLAINGRLMEATSYQVPGVFPAVLLSLRKLELTPLAAEPGEQAITSLVKVITDFGQAITASLDFESTAQAVLENLARVLSADVVELKIWEAKGDVPITYGLQEASDTAPKLVRLAISHFADYTAQVLDSQRPVLLAALGEQHPANGKERRQIRSYLGCPLQAKGDWLGVVELGRSSGMPFGESDLELLQLFCGQAAQALRNALDYEREHRHATELAALANLGQAVNVLHEPKHLFRRLVETISPLFAAEIIGFLIYDETKSVLEGQVPFQGLPAQIVEIYRTTIRSNSPAEALLKNPEPIVSEDASRDEKWRVLGLTHVAVAASLRDSVLMPLVANGRMVGYLQVSHHRGGAAPFSPAELRLIRAVADQAAILIENALFVQQAQARSSRSEALRRIASLASSSATPDEMLQFAVRELVSLFHADAAAVFLLDDERGELNLHRPSVFGVTDDFADVFSHLFASESEYHLIVSRSQKPFLSGRLSADRRVLNTYRPLTIALRLESAMVVPLLAHENCLGELMIGSSRPDHFSEYDLQVLGTVASQLAVAIESARALAQTDEGLRRRLEQLTAVARVSRELGTTFDLRRLLEMIYSECRKITRAECGSILLFNPENTNETPEIALSVGCPVESELSLLERAVVEGGKSRLIANFGRAEFQPPHAEVRSALLVPVAYQGRTLGLIYLHGSQPSFFDETARETIETLAIQAAIAIHNARQYQMERQRAEILSRRAETLTSLVNTTYALSAEKPLEQALQAIAQGICAATPFRVALVSIYEKDSGLLRRVAGVGLPADTLADLMGRKQPYASLRQLMREEFKIGRAYFIPADQTPILPADVHYVYSRYERSEAVSAKDAWNPDDFLLIPLEDAEGNPLGLISVDDPSNGLRPDRVTLESLEGFAAQAALVIQNMLQINTLQERIQALSDGLQRQQKLLHYSQNDLPILLHKDLEQTISLHALERRAQRVRAGLAITESVSRQLDASSALLALGRETLTHLGMSVALVAEEGPDGPHLLHVLGTVPRATNVEALFGQRNPLRSVLQSGETLLIANLDENDEWRDTPLLSALRAKGVIGLPIKVEGRVVAAMLAISLEPLPPFTDEDRQVYQQIARQTSVVLQNISLLNETRRRLQEVNLLLDFSRRLSGLNPDEVLKALLESARRVLSAAHAGVVFLWQPQTGQLVPRVVSGYADNQSLLKISYHLGEALPGAVFAERKARRVDEIHFAYDYSLEAEKLLLYRQATGGRLPVSSLLIPIAAGEQPLGLLVLDNFNTPAAFRPEDEALLLSLAQQVALSLENIRLVQAAQERAGQLQALNDAATAMTTRLRSDELIGTLLEHLASILPYDTATLWLRERDRLTVAAASGFPDTEKRLGLSVALSDSALFRQMIESGQPISVGDVREDARFPALEAPRLSWLGIPLIAKGELSGVIALEKWQAHFYTHDHLQVAMAFATQAAVSLENARLYEDSLKRAMELDQRSQRLALLNRFSSSLSGLLDGDQILELTAAELQQALNAKRVLVVVFERGQAVWKTVIPKTKIKLPRVLPHAPLFDRLRESLGVFHTSHAQQEAEIAPLLDVLGESTASLLVLPLVSGADLRALLFVTASSDDTFSLNEIELGRTIANQASIALENARLYQSTRQTAERFAILNRSSAQISATLDPEQIYALVHQAAEQVMPVEAFVITILNEENHEIQGVYLVDKGVRLPPAIVPWEGSLSGKIIQTGQPLITHLEEEAERAGGISYGDEASPISILAVPMTLGNKVIGMLSAQSYRPDVYTEEDLQILGTLANQLAVAIQNARLFAETQRLAQELEQRVIERTAQLQREQQNTETLLRILTEVSSSLDLDRALNRTLSLLNDATGAEQGTIMLLQPEDNLLHYRAGYGYLSDQSGGGRGFTLKVGEGLAGWVVQNREAVLIDDLRQDPRWVQSPASGQDHRSAIVAPLLVGEDVIGVLMIFHRQVGFFNPEMLNLAKAIASQVAVAINNAHLYELIRDQAERLGAMLRKEQEEASRSVAILEAVADGVLVTDAENRITFVNSSTERILGLSANRLLGQPLENFGGLFGKAAGAWLEAIRLWSDDPASYRPGDMVAEQLELENGRIALIHLAPVIFQNDFLGTVSIFRDITHEVEVDRLKSEFVATVSHELRTPMTSIKGYVDLLLMGAAGAFNENQAHFLQIVKSNAERLNALVNDLLDVSRIEAGRVTLTPQPLNLRDVAEEVLAEALRRSQEEQKPMAFSLDAPKSLPRVLGDPERVRQILGNLVDNAYHYTPANGTIKVRIAAINGNEVQVDVEDNGVGISPQDQARIFERFYRGDHPLVLATPGTGLGLSIVRQLVEMHNGRIWVTSKGVPGEGSTFSFTLPVIKN